MRPLVSLALMVALLLASPFEFSSKKQQVEASGVFEINFSSLLDSYGRDLRDDCCQWQNETANEAAAYQPCDPTKCQLIIRICVKNYQTQMEASQCTFGELSAQVMRPSEAAQFAAQYPRLLQQQQQQQPQKTPLPAPRLAPPPPQVAPAIQQQGQQRRQSAANIHHQRMLFQQQHQPLLAAASSSRQQQAQQQQQQQQQPQQLQPQNFQFVSSGQPRALRTIAFDQPISFPFNFTWPGSFSLFIDAWFESPTGLQHKVALPNHLGSAQVARDTTYDLYRKQLIIRHSMHGWLPVKEEWTSDVRRSDEATLTYAYRVTCQPNYYGQQCNILCRPRDDVYGHYTCNAQGSIQCLPGWQGAYCLEPICSPGCHKDQGYCARPNECQCRSGFRGPQCRECQLYPGCVHGTCQKPHDCICREGWGGLLCDEDLNFCTNHKPCHNDGLCTNAFNEQGVGSYNCTCQPGFTGANCEFSLGAPAINSSLDPIEGPLVASPNSTVAASSDLPPAFEEKPPQPAEQVAAVVVAQQPQQQQQQQPSIAASQATHQPPPHHQKPHQRAAKAGSPLLTRQLVMQQQQQDNQSSLAGTISVCSLVAALVLVLALLLARHQERLGRLRHSRAATSLSRSEDNVAALQNQQNIYKSRTSLATDKVPFAAQSDGDSSTLSSATYQRWPPSGVVDAQLGGLANGGLSRHQLAELERHFHESQYPSQRLCDELAHKLGLESSERVRHWFSSRRSQQRRHDKISATYGHSLGVGVQVERQQQHYQQQQHHEQQQLYLHRSYHNLAPAHSTHLATNAASVVASASTAALSPPPPPYTISHSHPTAYINHHPHQPTYQSGASLYAPASHLGHPAATAAAIYGSALYGRAGHSLSQHQLAAAANPYGSATPYYVICLDQQQQQQQQRNQSHQEPSSSTRPTTPTTTTSSSGSEGGNSPQKAANSSSKMKANNGNNEPCDV